MTRAAIFVVMGALIFAPASVSVQAHEAGTYESPIVESRVKRFKQSGGDIQAIFKQHLPAGNFAAIEAAAKRLAVWADEMPAQFPQGSESVGADDDIWDDFSDFEAKAAAMGVAAHKLSTAARLADSGQAAAAAKRVGATCKSCHQEYRIKH